MDGSSACNALPPLPGCIHVHTAPAQLSQVHHPTRPSASLGQYMRDQARGSVPQPGRACVRASRMPGGRPYDVTRGGDGGRSARPQRVRHVGAAAAPAGTRSRPLHKRGTVGRRQGRVPLRSLRGAQVGNALPCHHPWTEPRGDHRRRRRQPGHCRANGAATGRFTSATMHPHNVFGQRPPDFAALARTYADLAP